MPLLLLTAGCASLLGFRAERAPLSAYDQALLDLSAGLLADGEGRHETAAAYFRRVLAAAPNVLSARRSLIGALVRAGNPQKAIEEFHPILDRKLADARDVNLAGALYESVGNSFAAEAIYRKLLASEPSQSETQCALGLLLLKQNRGEEGETHLREALRLAPENRDARRALAKLAVGRERLDEAERLLRGGLESDPDDEEWLVTLARLLSLRGAAEAATAVNRKLLQINPNQAEAHQFFAEYHLEKQQWREAADHLEWLLAAEPKRAHWMRNLGLAYYQLGRLNEARELVQPLTESGHADGLTHYLLGSIYRQKHLWRLAAQEYETALQLNSRIYEAGVELADVLIAVGSEAEATAAVEKVLNQAGRSPTLLVRCGVLMMRLKQWTRARDALRQAAALEPKNAPLQFQLGRAYFESGDFESAVAAWERAVQFDPKLADAYNHLGYLHADRGLKLNQALRWIRRALALEPDNGNYHDSLGWAYYRFGRYAEALSELQTALDLLRSQSESVDPVVFDHLGDTYFKLKRPSEAAAAWQEALKADPNNLDIRGKLEKLNQTPRSKERGIRSEANP